LKFSSSRYVTGMMDDAYLLWIMDGMYCNLVIGIKLWRSISIGSSRWKLLGGIPVVYWVCCIANIACARYLIGIKMGVAYNLFVDYRYAA